MSRHDGGGCSRSDYLGCKETPTPNYRRRLLENTMLAEEASQQPGHYHAMVRVAYKTAA